VDRFENGFSFSQHLMIPKSQDVYFLVGQECAALFISSARCVGVMLPAIQLDGQLGLVTIEVKNVPAARMLPAKLKSTKAPVAQQFPH